MGGGDVHIVEMRRNACFLCSFWSECIHLLIYFHFTGSENATFNQECQNPWKNGKTKQEVSPRVPCPASQTLYIWVETVCFCLFSRGFLPLCQSNNDDAWAPEMFILTNIGTAASPLHILSHRIHVWYIYLHLGDFLGHMLVNIPYMEHLGILMSSLSCWFWLLGHQRKRTVKTARGLYYPPLQALHWTDILLVCRGFGSSSLKVWLVFFKPGITKSDI